MDGRRKGEGSQESMARGEAHESFTGPCLPTTCRVRAGAASRPREGHPPLCGPGPVASGQRAGEAVRLGIEEQVARHRRARPAWLMAGCMWPGSPTMPGAQSSVPSPVVCALWQGDPGKRGGGEKAAFSPGSLWPPQVLPAGVHLRGGGAGPLPGPGAVTQGDDREVQSDAESQRPGLRPQATLRDTPACPRRDSENLFG